MATYIQGLTDYIPQIQPFKPDLNFYSTVLQTRQTRHDSARNKLGSLYGSLLYSPLTHADNIKRRDEFFKAIEQDLKKISGLDLSRQENIDAAVAIFDPLIKDKSIAHDMGFTKYESDQMKVGEALRFSSDPEKTGGFYSPEAALAIQYRLNEYANSDLNTRLSMAPKRFTPFFNTQKMALDYAKSLGWVATRAKKGGGYIYKYSNGMEIEPEIRQAFEANFANDPRFLEMYDTKAYVKRKQYIEGKSAELGAEEAEKSWFNLVMSVTAPELQKEVNAVDDMKSDVILKKAIIENTITKDGVVQDDPLVMDLIATGQSLAVIESLSKSNEKVTNAMKAMGSGTEDMNNMRNQIDYLVSRGFLREDLDAASRIFARANSGITDMSADPYSKSLYDHQLSIQKSYIDAGIDIEKAISLAYIDLKKQEALAMSTAGLPTDNYFYEVKGSPDGMTGTGTPIYEKTIEAIEALTGKKGAQGIVATQMDYVGTTTSFLFSEAEQSEKGDTGKAYARKLLKSMYGSSYNESTNKFVKNGIEYTNWKDLNIDQKSLNTLYNNSKIINDKNKNLYKNLYGNVERIEQANDLFTKQLNGYATELYGNVYGVLSQSKNRIPEYKKDPNGFMMMFQDLGNNKTAVVNETSYVERIMSDPNTSWSGSKMNVEQKKDYLRKQYRRYQSAFAAEYNKGSESYNNFKSPFAQNVGLGADGGVASNQVSMKTNKTVPLLSGNYYLASLQKDVTNGNVMKYLPGQFHIKDDYDDAESDSQAQALFSAYVSDLAYGRFTTDSSKEEAPFADVLYAKTAANSADISRVTLANINPKWLMRYEDSKTKKVFGQDISYWMTNGVSAYLNAEGAQNEFANALSRKPFDVMLEREPMVIKRQNAGSLRITQEGPSNISGGNTYVIEGMIPGYDAAGNLSGVKYYNRISSVSGSDAVTFSGQLLDMISKANTDFIESGGKTKYYDVESLLRAIKPPKAEAEVPYSGGSGEAFLKLMGKQ